MISYLHALRARQLRRRGDPRSQLLSRSIARLSRARAPGAYSTLWTDAIYGWGNEKWSAEERYLAEVVRSAERTDGPILECGSGLTTLLLGAVAARTGVQVHALEHNAEWHGRVTQSMRDFGMRNVTAHLTPLRDFGDYDWYDVSLATLPRGFTFVICDGPPASTRGGRSGMIPTMHDKLARACEILLDDLVRPAEQELVRRWVLELGATAETRTSGRGFARVKLLGA